MTTPLSSRQLGFRLPMGEWFNDIIDRVNAIVAGTVSGTYNGTLGGTTPAAASVTSFTQNGTETATPQLANAAGSNSQANATPVTKSNVIVILVSATTRALRLPAAATGKIVRIFNDTTTGVKIYPATGATIGAAATNAVGTAIATRKGTIYYARNTNHWITLVGA